MLSLGNDHSGIGDIEEERKGSRSLLDKSRRLLWILDVDPVHLQKDMSQFDTRRASRRPLNNERDNRAIVQSIY